MPRLMSCQINMLDSDVGSYTKLVYFYHHACKPFIKQSKFFYLVFGRKGDEGVGLLGFKFAGQVTLRLCYLNNM